MTTEVDVVTVIRAAPETLFDLELDAGIHAARGERAQPPEAPRRRR